MKVLVINGSPRNNGCTDRALREVEQTLLAEGIETERVNIGNKDIRGCAACNFCREHGRCVFNDAVNEVAPQFAEADALVVGSPVYYAGCNGQLLAFLDRLFYSTSRVFDKTMKLGAAVLSSRRAGSTSAFDEINKYFAISAMPIVSSTYWNEVHGATTADVDDDLEGLQTLRNLGRNMVFLLKAIDRMRSDIPKQDRSNVTNFHE